MKNTKYDCFICKYSAEFSLEVALIKALIQVESSFKERAYRFEPAFYDRYIKDNAKYLDHVYYSYPRIISASFGLTQLMYLTAEELGFKNVDPEILYDPEANIKLGCKFLRKKINLYGLERGILAYNSGSPRYSDPTIEHNYCYLKKIAKNYKKFGGINEEILKHA